MPLCSRRQRCVWPSRQHPPNTTSQPLTYIRAGRLFDSTSDNYRENVVIVVEGERIKAMRARGFSANPQRRQSHRPVEGDGASRVDRLPHPPGRARRPVQPHQPLQVDALHGRLRRGEKRAHNAACRFHHRARRRAQARSWPSTCATTSTRDTSSARAWLPAGRRISITGGHGDLNNFSPETSVTLFPAERNYQIADGPDQVRQSCARR